MKAKATHVSAGSAQGDTVPLMCCAGVYRAWKPAQIAAGKRSQCRSSAAVPGHLQEDNLPAAFRHCPMRRRNLIWGFFLSPLSEGKQQGFSLQLIL